MTKTATAKAPALKAAPGHVLVYCILFDLDGDRSGPAGDGTDTYRTTNPDLAASFIKGRTCYGNPIELGEPDQVTRKLYTRWCREGKA